MTEIEMERVRAELQRSVPHRVRCYRDETLLNEIPVPPGRKRWHAVLGVLSRIDWSRLELVDRSGGLVGICDRERPDEPEAPPEVEIETQRSDDRVLELLLKAQQIALSNRERETQLALNACTASVKMLTDAVAALAQVHRMTLDTQAQAFQTAMEAGNAAATEEQSSSKLLEQMAPMIVAKMLAPPPAAPPPPPPPNGVKGAGS